MQRLLTLATVILALSTPASAENISDQVARQVVEGIIGAYVTGMKKSDSRELAGLYTHDGLIVRPAGPISGMEAITRFYQDVVKVVVDLAVDIDQVKVLSDGVILANGTSQNTNRSPNGSPQKGPKTYWVVNVVHQNGSWKIRMIASSSTGFTVPSEKRD